MEGKKALLPIKAKFESKNLFEPTKRLEAINGLEATKPKIEDDNSNVGNFKSKAPIELPSRLKPKNNLEATRRQIEDNNSNLVNMELPVQPKKRLEPTDYTEAANPLIEDNENSGVGNSVFYDKNVISRMRTLPRREKLNLTFDNLVLTVQINRRKKEYKTLLKGVSGSLNGGELIALMGPSGAGKSTLMNVLAGYKVSNVKGKITVNDEDRNMKEFRKLSCYIMQNDELLPHLTVMESMIVSANLKLTEKKSFDEKLDMVNEILQNLGLSKHKNTKCNQLSGGQRKRLSVAQELVNNPPLMFLDEPTSGLDSQSSFQCINVLKSLAKDGRTIVCTIHQPSAKLFELFDKLYILSDGVCVYNGTVPALIPYMASQNLACPPFHNPADFVIEVACGEYGNVTERLARSVQSGECDRWDADFARTSRHTRLLDDFKLALKKLETSSNDNLSSQNQLAQHRHAPWMDKPNKNAMVILNKAGDVETVSISVPESDSSESDKKALGKCAFNSTWDWRFFASLPCTAFWILFLRTFKCIIRDKNLSLLRLISHICVGVLIGLLYLRIGNGGSISTIKDNASCIFLSLLFLMFTALMPTVMTFPMEMNVFIREHLNCWYNLRTYYFAKTMADIPFQIILPTVYSTIIYWMTDQPNDIQSFLLFLTFSILVSMTAQSLGLLIGAATSLQVAVFLGPITAIPILLFSGFFVKVAKMPVYLKWVSYLSYIRYAFDGTLLTIYHEDRPALTCSVGTSTLNGTCLTHSKTILESIEVADSIMWQNFVILIAFFLFFRITCYLVLHWRIRSRR